MQIAHNQIRGPQQSIAVVASEAIEVVRTHNIVKRLPAHRKVGRPQRKVESAVPIDSPLARPWPGERLPRNGKPSATAASRMNLATARSNETAWSSITAQVNRCALPGETIFLAVGHGPLEGLLRPRPTTRGALSATDSNRRSVR